MKRRLITRGVLLEAAPDAYYLDEERVTRFAARRRTVAIVILVIGVLLIPFAPRATAVCLVAGIFALLRGRP